MSAITHDLMQCDTGLPEPVRQALNERGRACNLAAIAVNQAFAVVMQYTTAREMRAADEPDDQRSQSVRPSPQAQVIADLEMIADSFYAQTLVALTRAAASYAIYASQVAVAVVAGQSLPLPGTEQIRPSDLIAALDHFLPLVQFSSAADDSHLAEQNDKVRTAHEALRQIVSQQLWGHDAQAYDDPSAARAGAGEPYGIADTFPEALHEYAAAVAWALGVVMATHDGGGAG
jgi:hypothetical protein